MIIKKPIEKGSIVTFRLITGETLLARFVSHTAAALVITKPVVANAVQQEGRYGIFYSPFCPTVDEIEEHSIPSTALVLNPIQPREELVANYLKMTSSLAV
jgi:hypothetical protein